MVPDSGTAFGPNRYHITSKKGQALGSKTRNSVVKPKKRNHRAETFETHLKQIKEQTRAIVTLFRSPCTWSGSLSWRPWAAGSTRQYESILTAHLFLIT